MDAKLVILLLTTIALPASAQNKLICAGGRDPVRAAAIHTQADYALACTDPQGVWHGSYEERSTDGHIAVSGRYDHGQPDGLWIFFYSTGVEMSRGNFRSGQRQGRWYSFYESGKKFGEGPYRNDLLNGHWTTWYENGKRRSDGNYLDGEEIGRWTYWFPNGQLDREGDYQGKHTLPPLDISVPAESGKWTYWYENGRKRMEGCYRNGERVGLWKEWSEDGKLLPSKSADGSDCH